MNCAEVNGGREKGRCRSDGLHHEGSRMTQEGQGICIGDPQGEYLQILIFGRSYPEATDFWDGNWLRSEVAAKIGGFQCRFEAALRAEEFRLFQAALAELHQSLNGDAVFSTLEGQVKITLKGDGQGHIDVRIRMCDLPGSGNRFEGEFRIDQTYLRGIQAGLDGLLADYPPIGTS